MQMSGRPRAQYLAHPRCGAYARTTGDACRNAAMANGRCRPCPMPPSKSCGPFKPTLPHLTGLAADIAGLTADMRGHSATANALATLAHAIDRKRAKRAVDQ